MTPHSEKASPGDHWSDWVLHKRHGGDSDYERSVRRKLRQICDRVLDGAKLRPGETLLDIGCGDGLIGFAALQREPGLARAIFLDVSPALIAYVAGVAAERGLTAPCSFIVGSAERLAAPPMAWDTLLNLTPHPLARSLREILAEEFTAEEAVRLEARLRPAVETGGQHERDAIAYLTATKPD